MSGAFSSDAFDIEAFSTDAFDFGLLEIFVQLQGNAWTPTPQAKTETIKPRHVIKPHEKRPDELEKIISDDEQLLLLVAAAVARNVNG